MIMIISKVIIDTNAWYLILQRMEKENATLKIRMQHKEQTLKRFQQFIEEIRLEQLSMIDQHSREQLNLQETILEQPRTLHRSTKLR